MKESSSIKPPLINVVLCGGFSGAVADTILHSMDTVKTRMQGQLSTSIKQKYNSIFHAFHSIIKNEGPQALFGGFSAAVIGSFLSTSVYFFSYETIKRRLQQEGIGDTTSYLIAGGAGDVLASVFYVPSEVLKTRLQLKSHHYTSTWDAIKKIKKNNTGVSGFYRGFFSTCMRDIPFSSLLFTFYETIKSSLIRNKVFTVYNKDSKLYELTAVHDMFSGAVSGFVAGTITTPLDVVKTYLQTQKMQTGTTFVDNSKLPNIQAIPASSKPFGLAGIVASQQRNLSAELLNSRQFNTSTMARNLSKQIPSSKIPSTPAVYPGVISAFRGIYRRSGVSGLFYGVGPRSFWCGMQSMIMFCIYESLINVLKEEQ